MKNNKYLSERLTHLPSNNIPLHAALVSERSPTYVLTFRFYKEDLCEVPLLPKNCPKECIQVFKRITQTTLGPSNLREKNIDQIPIRNEGEYQKLFSRLTRDVDLYEHKIQGTARLFYFIAAHEFCVVAIASNHYETSKQRK